MGVFNSAPKTAFWIPYILWSFIRKKSIRMLCCQWTCLRREIRYNCPTLENFTKPRGKPESSPWVAPKTSSQLPKHLYIGIYLKLLMSFAIKSEVQGLDPTLVHLSRIWQILSLNALGPKYLNKL